MDKAIPRVYLVGTDYDPLKEVFPAISLHTVASHQEEKSKAEKEGYATKRLHCIVDTTDIRSKVCTQIDLNLICSTITTDMIFFQCFTYVKMDIVMKTIHPHVLQPGMPQLSHSVTIFFDLWLALGDNLFFS